MGQRHIERGTDWMITIQAPQGSDEHWAMKMPRSWETKYSYKCFVYERGRKATSIHCHLLIRFNEAKRSNTLARELIQRNKGCEVDIQRRQGTWEEAKKYIMKQDDTKIEGRPPVEFGTHPREYRRRENCGKEKDKMKEIVNIIKDEGLNGLLEEHGEELMKYPGGCKLIKEITAKKSEKRTVLVTIIWGEAGTGKSTWAQQEAHKRWGESVYYFTKVGGSKDTVWFNGYEDQKCIILDDISGRSLPYEYLIKITGNDPLDIEIKGGRKAAVWEEVIITSNYNPMNWYTRIWEECNETREAFLRRINRIVHVTKDEDGNAVWKMEREVPVSVMRDDFYIEPMWERTPDYIKEERRSEEERDLMEKEDKNVLQEEEITPAPKRIPLMNIQKAEAKEILDNFYLTNMDVQWDKDDEEGEGECSTKEYYNFFKITEDDVENGGNKE